VTENGKHLKVNNYVVEDSGQAAKGESLSEGRSHNNNNNNMSGGSSSQKYSLSGMGGAIDFSRKDKQHLIVVSGQSHQLQQSNQYNQSDPNLRTNTDHGVKLQHLISLSS